MIISASTRTDIPAFYMDWLLERLKEGYVLVRNPYNTRQISKYILSPKVVDVLVLWTKNPKQILVNLEKLALFRPYIFVTITPYGREIEPHVPEKKELLRQTVELAKKVGKDSICLRYDPIVLTDRYTIEYHCKAFETILIAISGHIREVIISFLDVYEKTKRNFREGRPLSLEEQEIIAEKFGKLAERYGVTLKTCAEAIDLKKYGIYNSGCISREVMERHLGVSLKEKRHAPDREYCRCMETKDIGAYNSCLHGCAYCYANFNRGTVISNYEKHDPHSPLLIGTIRPDDVIREAKQESLLDGQIRLKL